MKISAPKTYKFIKSVRDLSAADASAPFAILRWCDKFHPAIRPTRKIARVIYILTLNFSSPLPAEHVQLAMLARLNLSNTARTIQVRTKQ